MKKLFFLCLSIFAFTAFSQKSEGSLALVLENMKQQETSWNEGDLKGFMRHYWNSDSLKFIGSKGVTRGWQKTLDNYLKSYPNKTAMGVLKFSIVASEQLSPESIYVIGKWELQKEKPSGGHFTLLWKKIDNRWLIVADHTS